LITLITNAHPKVVQILGRNISQYAVRSELIVLGYVLTMIGLFRLRLSRFPIGSAQSTFCFLMCPMTQYKTRVKTHGISASRGSDISLLYDVNDLR